MVTDYRDRQRQLPATETETETQRDTSGRETVRALLLDHGENPVDPRSNPVDRFICNLQCFVCVCVRYKKHGVLQGFGPLGGREFHLGDVKKNVVFSIFFALRGGKNCKKLYRNMFST